MAWDELIAKYDRGDYLGKLLGFPQQCLEGWKLGKKARIKRASGIEKIFITGMGGSGYSGELLQKLYFGLSYIPVFVEHGHILPKFVDKKTLCIVISYSGTTEESLSIFKELKRKKIPTVCIASGGDLKKECDNCIVVPQGYQPRQATGYLFFSMLAVLQKAGLAVFNEREVKEAVQTMKKEQVRLMEKSREIAKMLYKKMPVVYASEKLSASALRWQTELNEIAKVFCHSNVLPELQHNEINASLGLGKAHFFLLHTGEESKKMNARIEFMKKRIKSIGYGFTEIEAKGNGLLAKSWYANYLGSFAAFHLAMLSGIDPTSVKLIQAMKAYLKRKF